MDIATHEDTNVKRFEYDSIQEEDLYKRFHIHQKWKSLWGLKYTSRQSTSTASNYHAIFPKMKSESRVH